jgi:hypothetical protein
MGLLSNAREPDFHVGAWGKVELLNEEIRLPILESMATDRDQQWMDYAS